MATVIGKTAAAIAALLAEKLDLAGGTLTGDLLLPNNKLRAGTASDVIGTALEVMRNGVQVGRIDNNLSGLRVQATSGTLQLRGSGNNGISIDSSGIATFANEPIIGASALNEFIDDRVAALLVQGSNVTLSYNDAAGTLTISSSGGGGAASPVPTMVAPVGSFIGPYLPGGSAVTRVVPTTNPVPTLFLIPTTVSVDQVGIQVEAAEAGRSAKVLIYATGSDGLPYSGSKIIETVHSLATTGNVITTLGAAVTLPPGIYIANVIADATTTATVSCAQFGVVAPPFGTFNQLRVMPTQGGTKFDVGTYAAPSTGATPVLATGWGSNNSPIVGLRRSS